MLRRFHGPRASTGGAARRLVRASLAVAALGELAACVAPREPLPSVWVEIPSDASVEAIAESLVTHGIIRSAERFVQMARYRNRVADLKPGVYPLRPDSREYRVLRELLRGRPPAAKVVIRERMTLIEVAWELEAVLGLQPAAVLETARDSALRARVATRGPTIEGYLYPTAYYVSRDASPLEVLRQMADTFAARWRPAWNPRLDSLSLSRDKIVILASIIAGEMPLGEERFLVSSTYHNRLRQGMRLQADPTVVYALGTRRRLTFEDYRIRSPYNTYAIAGLPPGPIGQPSVQSLEAALYPAESEYLYMVAQGDSSHAFSRSYVEHLRTIRQIRRGDGSR
jgi:UPF0755 protein